MLFPGLCLDRTCGDQSTGTTLTLAGCPITDVPKMSMRALRSSWWPIRRKLTGLMHPMIRRHTTGFLGRKGYPRGQVDVILQVRQPYGCVGTFWVVTTNQRCCSVQLRLFQCSLIAQLHLDGMQSAGAASLSRIIFISRLTISGFLRRLTTTLFICGRI